MFVVIMNKVWLLAEGYARTRLSLGVGIVTTGPGGTNALQALLALG